MKTARLAFLPSLLLTVVGSGCTITIGPYDDTGGDAPRETSILPDPMEGPVDEPLLDEAQRARKEEADRYIAQVIYKGGEIAHESNAFRASIDWARCMGRPQRRGLMFVR